MVSTGANEQFDGVPDVNDADPVRRSGDRYAGEDRFMVRGAVAEALDVRCALLHVVSCRASDPAAGRCGGGGEAEPERGAPEVAVAVDGPPERRCPDALTDAGLLH